MGIGGAEIHELAGQCRGHGPSCGRRTLRRDIAEVHQQAVVDPLVVDPRAKQGEVHQQPLLVVDDPGLGGIDLQSCRRAMAVVANAQPQVEGDGRFDLGSQRIVGVHVAGQEVVQRQTRHRAHGDHVRSDRHRGDIPSRVVGQVRTHAVQGTRRDFARGPGRRDDQPAYVGRGPGGHAAAAVHRVDALQVIQPKKERRVGVLRIRGCLYGYAIAVLETYRDPDIGEVDMGQPVVNPHVRVEGLSLQGEVLLDLDAHGGAQRSRLREHRRRGQHPRQDDGDGEQESTGRTASAATNAGGVGKVGGRTEIHVVSYFLP